MKQESKGNLTQKQESLNQLESGQLSMNVKEQENNSESGKIIETTRYINTPFHKVKLENGSFIAIGNKRVTEIITEQEADKLVRAKDWNLLTSLIAVVTEGILQETK